ncbi:recombination protein RecR [Desulfocucumis palustris]|uniref:Recombination protein RecR n=1 Tax=Desulfocucumis palustris TaxID=1898651 RepID=A0A2L2XE30_9FIRM|nr:recombination mediator RecR [Desulfocucumis palustris]GBF34382.1 recombination protein RecR [Desulfocucumis palustris]
MHNTGPVARLVDEFARLPGIGPKTAQRLAFYILNQPAETAGRLAAALLEARESTRRCTVCLNLTDQEPCAVCADPRRTPGVICVVEQPRDVLAMEKSRSFKGLYHVLHGSLSPMNGIGPDELTVRELLKRIGEGKVKEVILATNPNVEGDATALYLSRLIQPLNVRVTRLAHGLPVGASLEYADEITLSKALEGRREL